MKVYIKDIQASNKRNEEAFEGVRGWHCSTEIDTANLFFDKNGVIQYKKDIADNFTGGRETRQREEMEA